MDTTIIFDLNLIAQTLGMLDLDMFKERPYEDSFQLAASAIAFALVEVLREEVSLSAVAAQKVYDRAKTHMAGIERTDKATHMLSKLSSNAAVDKAAAT